MTGPQAFSRRQMLRGAAVVAAGAGLVSLRDVSDGFAATKPAPHWFLPSDRLPHDRTWMAWPARKDVWGHQLAGVRADVASVARAIAEHEPVSMVARPEQAAQAAAGCGDGVEIVEIVNDDMWMRDIGPLFLIDGRGGMAGLDLNFNGWGHRQVHRHDARVAEQVLAHLGVPRIVAPFVAEGGALEVDGHGTAVATASSLVNDNRNPGKSKDELTQEICAAIGVRELIWVPGVRNHDITDDHIDSLARFVGPADVVVDQPGFAHATDVWAKSERKALKILQGSKDAQGRALRCRNSRESRTIPAGAHPALFVNVYVNWYVCNGAVLIPEFDDAQADAAARHLVGELYPHREVVPLRIDHVAEGGGGIHCITQQQPAV